MKKILIGLVGLVLAWMAQAGDDIDAVAAAVAANPAPAPDAPMRLKAVKAMSLQAAGADSGFKDYVYNATGELNVTKGEGTISLNFAVDRHFTEIESAKIVFNAYDVDYPEATEHDVAYFNGTSYIRLQGGNNTWHQNAFSVSPEKIRLPETTGQIANNSFYVTVDIGNEGWVTSIGWARLEIRGKEGIVLEASDGTDLDGIKVTWTEVKGVSSYDLYRSDMQDGGFKKIATVSGTEYLDETADYDHPFYYYVEVPGQTKASAYSAQLLGAAPSGKSNVDDGLKCDDALPEIESVDVAKLFLTEEGPYNVRINWNSFDEKRYCVESVKFVLEQKRPSSGYVFETEEINVRNKKGKDIADFDLSRGGKTFEADKFGEYSLKVVWKVYDINAETVVKSGIWWWKRDKEYDYERDGTCNVLFSKYKECGSGGFPNWYPYWMRCKAVRGLEKFRYQKAVCESVSGDPAKMVCQAGGYEKTAVPLTASTESGYVFPTLLRWTSSSFPLTVSSAAVARGNPIVLPDGSVVGAKRDVCGIRLLAAVISHELKHKEYGDILCQSGYRLTDAAGKVIGIDDINVDEIADMVGKTHFVAREGDRRDPQKLMEQYVNDLKSIRDAPASWHLDGDGDGVPDSEEGGLIFGLFAKTQPDNSDTHDLAHGYYQEGGAAVSYTSKTGDNEYLAHVAMSSPVSFSTKNDWAFPGSKLGADDPELEGAEEGAAIIERKKTEYQKIDGASSLLVSRALAKPSVASPVSFARNDDGHETYSIDRIDEMPMWETSVDGVVLTAVFIPSMNTPGGSFSSLKFAVTVSNDVLSAREYWVEGYLVDADERPIALARSRFTMRTGVQVVSLDFAGTVLYEQGGKGYRLGAIGLKEANVDLPETPVMKFVEVETDREYAASEFERKQVYLRAATSSDCRQGRNLEIVVDLDIDGGCAPFELSGTICDTNGNFVASSRPSIVQKSGKASLTFLGDDIYLAKCNGPYVLSFVQLKSQSEVVYSELDAYETGYYSFADFAPEDLTVAVNESSFAVCIGRSSVDNNVDALNFSFMLRNASASSLPYRIVANLSGRDGDPVGSQTVDVVLSPGENEINLSFAGAKLAKVAVPGPYVLNDVKLLSLGEVGSSDRFFPKMEPIDLNPEDFGAYPFDLRGDPVVWTGSGSGAYSVTVPLNIYRKNTVTVSALMVDADGKYVATAKKSVEYNGTGWADITVEFSEDDIQRSGRRGPYTIRYLQVASDLEGVLPLRVTSFKSQEIMRQYKLYVDASRPDDSGDGLTQATAKKTIQAAVDKAKSGDTVVVLGGKYAPFDTDNKSIEVLGLFGSERTVVDGGGTFRCATLGHEEQQTNTVLRGFTLRNGNSTGDELVLWNCGGGVCGGTVQNCVIENCTASKGGGAYYGRLENCLILDNVAETYGGGSYYGTRVNCTIVGNKAYYGGGGTYEGVSYNTIVYGNARGSSGSTADNWVNGSFSHCVTDPQPSGYNGNFDPCFADPKAGDYSLLLQSPCVDVGLDDVVRTETDLAGNVRRAGTHVDIGAFEFPQNPHTAGKADFVCSKLESEEGKTLSIAVWGGSQEVASSVTIYLASALGSAADLDLTKLKIDGQSVKNAKFPLKLSWDAGSVGARVVTVPVKADKSIEGDEAIVLMLGGATGMSVGSYDTCRISLKDLTVPGVSLATAANAVGIKVSTSGSGKWHAAVGESYYTSDKARGVYHLVTPKLAQGKTSKLSLGGIKGKGEMVVLFRFTGDASERTSSTLKIYAGKQLMRTYYHSSVGSKWQQYTITDPNKGSHAYSYVFTQGSDPNAAVEMSSAIWLPSGSDKPFTVYVTTLDANDGYVTGMGFYRKGQTAKISAKPKPGRKFDAWYRWSVAEGRYVRWKTSASLSFKVEEETDVTAVFVRNPLVTVLPSPAEGGTVSGGGYCASNKTLTLKAKPARGYVFVGWYLNGVCVSQKTSQSVRPSSGDVTYQGVFVTAADDKASLAFVTDPTAVAHMETNLVPYVGVRFDMPLAWTSCSKASVSAKNLPKGLKVSEGRITGVPTAAGVKTSTLTLKNTSTSKSLKVVFDVQPLAGWAKGSYYGYVGDATGATNGLATLTVSSVGKLSGKFAEHGTNWTIAAASYDAVYPDSPAYFAAATASYTYSAKVKSGNKTKTVKTTLKRPFQVYIGANALGYGVASAFETDGYTWFDAWQNVWGGAYKAIGKELFYTSKKKAYKTFVFVGGDGENGFRYGLGEDQSLSVKVTTAGQVTATGAFPHVVVKKDKKGRPYEATDVYKPTCTTVLLPTTSAAEGSDGFSGVAFIYFAPSTKNGFAGYSACVEIPGGI